MCVTKFVYAFTSGFNFNYKYNKMNVVATKFDESIVSCFGHINVVSMKLVLKMVIYFIFYYYRFQ